MVCIFSPKMQFLSLFSVILIYTKSMKGIEKTQKTRPGMSPKYMGWGIGIASEKSCSVSCDVVKSLKP